MDKNAKLVERKTEGGEYYELELDDALASQVPGEATGFHEHRVDADVHTVCQPSKTLEAINNLATPTAPVLAAEAAIVGVIDTPEFGKVVGKYCMTGERTAFDNLIAHINTHITAQVAKARQEGEELRRQDHAQACTITHALMAERDALKASHSAAAPATPSVPEATAYKLQDGEKIFYCRLGQTSDGLPFMTDSDQHGVWDVAMVFGKGEKRPSRAFLESYFTQDAAPQAAQPEAAPSAYKVPGDGPFGGITIKVDPTLPADTVEMRGANRVRLNIKTGEMSEAAPSDKQELIDHMRKISETVATWPAWKTGLAPAPVVTEGDVPQMLKDLRSLRDQAGGELRHTYNEVCDRLDVLVSKIVRTKEPK